MKEEAMDQAKIITEAKSSIQHSKQNSQVEKIDNKKVTELSSTEISDLIKKFENSIEKQEADGKIDEILENPSKNKIFVIIVNKGNLKVLQKLIQDSNRFLKKIDKSLWDDLMTLSLQKEFIEIFKELRKLEKEYTKDGDDETQCKYKAIVKDIESLHDNIANNKINKVENFFKKSSLKYCYDLNGISAFERSIIERKFGIFALLLGKCLCSEKALNEIENNQNEIYKSEEKEKILEVIVCNRAIKILEKLITYVKNFVANVDAKLWLKLHNLSAEKEFFEIFNKLKELEKHYGTENVEQLEGYNTYQTVLKDISQLHEDISDGNYQKVKEFIDKYPKPKLKFCYYESDSGNYCALEKAILSKKFDIYALLRSERFESSDSHRLKGNVLNARLAGMIEGLNYDEKANIRNELLKFTKKNTKFFIDILYNNCELDACSSDLSTNGIRDMLETLHDIKEFKPVIEILAVADVKIIFDLQSENMKDSDPTRDLNVYGVTYAEEKRFHVAKNENPDKMRGTFAHEATHMALHLIYENNYLPYRVEDKEREKEWDGIVQDVRKAFNDKGNEKKHSDIVRRVFNQEGKEEEIEKEKFELIVRVNHILATFNGKKKKIKRYRKLYKKLFNFYSNKVLPDLRRDFYTIIKLNNDLKLFNEIKDSKFQIKATQNGNILETENSKNYLIYSNAPQLTLSHLCKQMLSKCNESKLHIKAKNIFINLERLEQESLRRELEEVLKTSSNLKEFKVLIRIKNNLNAHISKLQDFLHFLKDLTDPIQIFLIASLKDESICIKELYENSSNENSEVYIKTFVNETSQTCVNTMKTIKFSKIMRKHSYQELTEESKEELSKLEIKFRNESIALGSLYKPDSMPTFEDLNYLHSTEFKVEPLKPEKQGQFIPRMFESKMNNSEVLTTNLNDFIKFTRQDKVVVISDLAGSGKTTLLHKVHENLEEKFKNFWIAFVTLKEHKELLKNSLQIGENFLEIVSEKILKLNELERKIFEFKYERNEVVILFDGFDEISPSCKKNSLKFFELHKNNKRRKSQIWVTTRTHLEHEIESTLNVTAHAIKSLTEEEQIKYLSEFWQETCDDKDLREKCAKLLVKEMTKMSRAFPNLIGIILQLRLLGERFKNELSVNFKEETIKNLNIFDVYEYLAQRCTEFKEQDSIHNILEYTTSSYEAFALKNFLGDEFPHLFGRTSTLEDFELENKLEEFTKGGIIRYDKDGKVSFLHQTVDEFFVSRFVKNRIKSFKPNWQYEKDFFELLFKILRGFKFSVVKEFLDNSLSNFEEEIAKEEYKNFQKGLVKFVNESFESFDLVFSKGLSVTSFLVLKCIKMESDETFKKIIKSEKAVYFYPSYFCDCVERTENLGLLEKFLDEVFSTYADDSELFDLLMEQDFERETIFHRIARERNFETFKKFWLKVEERNFEHEKVLRYFSSRAGKGKFFSFNDKKFIFFSYIFDFTNFFDENSCNVTEILQRNLRTNDGRRMFSEKEFKEESFVDDEPTFKKVLEFTRKVFDSEDLKKKLEEFDRNDVKGIFLEAARRSIEKVFELAFDENQNLKNEEIFDFSLKKEIWSQSFLKAAKQKFSAIFELIFNKVPFNVLTFKDFAYEIDVKGENIFNFLVFNGHVEIVKSFVTRARTELSDEEFKNYIKIKAKYFGSNALMISLLRNNFEVFRFLFDEVYLKVFMFKEFAYEVDEFGQNVFHLLVEWGNVEMVKYFLDRAQIEFLGEELKKFLKLKTEISQNIFHLVAKNWRNSDEIVKFLIEFVEELLTTEKMKELASQRDTVKRLPHECVDDKESEAHKILLEYFKN